MGDREIGSLDQMTDPKCPCCGRYSTRDAMCGVCRMISNIVEKQEPLEIDPCDPTEETYDVPENDHPARWR